MLDAIRRKLTPQRKSSLLAALQTLLKRTGLAWVISAAVDPGATWARMVVFESLAASKPESTLVSRDGLVVMAWDLDLGRRLYSLGNEENQQMERVLEILGRRSFDVGFDVGANIGTVTLAMLKSGVFGRVVAVEPEKRNVQFLRANVALAGLWDKVQIIERALGEREGTVELEMSDTESGDHRVRVGPAADGDMRAESTRATALVPQVTLDQVWQRAGRPGRCLVHIDVQGYEAYVLSGAPELLLTRPPMIIEFWPYGISRAAGEDKILEVIDKYEACYDLASGETWTTSRLHDKYAQITATRDLWFTDLLLVP